MKNEDTVKLLQECDAGTKIAVTAIDEVLDKVQDSKVNSLLNESKRRHSQLGNELHTLLLQDGSEDKNPNPMAKGMSWIKTNWKMGMEKSDAAAAELITDGCNMGVKSLSRYKNQYRDAGQKAKDICDQLIKLEETLAVDLRPYL